MRIPGIGVTSDPARHYYRTRSVSQLVHNPIIRYHAAPHIGRVKSFRVGRAVKREIRHSFKATYPHLARNHVIPIPRIHAPRPGKGITNHIRIPRPRV